MRKILTTLLFATTAFASMEMGNNPPEAQQPIQEAKILSIREFADSISLATRIPIEVIIGVGISETGWGKDGVGKPPINNIFGIRKGDGWSSSIWKCPSGEWRKYATKKSAIQDFCNFILKNYPWLLKRPLERWTLIGYGNPKYCKRGYFKQFKKNNYK